LPPEESLRDAAVQERLRACLRQLNSKKREGLFPRTQLRSAMSFRRSSVRPTGCRDALTVLIALYPVEVRFSFAIGEISTAINTKQAIGMDGPLFMRPGDD